MRRGIINKIYFDFCATFEFATISCNICMPAQFAVLTKRVHRAIDRGCTVGHTLEKGAATRLHLLDDEG